MCKTCELEAKNAADNNARANSSRLSGHGRKAHGQDAGRRRKNAEENQEDNVQAAWQMLYDQTLNRLLKERHPKGK